MSPGKIRELTNKIEELNRRITELEQRLSYYENANSPPSKNSLLYREMSRGKRSEREGAGGSAPRKPGRKDGHQGVTQVFKPTGQVVHTMERCPRCDSPSLSVISTERRTMVDIPEPLPYEVKEHVINVYRCSGCGADGLLPESVGRELPASSSSSSSSPLEGTKTNGIILGRNVLSTISLLWSVARLPQRKISYLLQSLYNLELSPATIGHALERASARLEAFHDKVRRGINRSKRANFDETGMPIAGRMGWIWVAATQKLAFVEVAMSRGRDVLEKCFPKFKGVAMVDGWKPYNFFALIQRCWAHVLREAEVLSLRARGKKGAEALLISLRNIFHETKSELKEHPPPNRELHDRMLRRLRYLLSKKRYRDTDVKKFVSKLKDASADLFTFTLYRGVEPTNNHAERELREPIVQRKIRGQLKTETGMKVFSRLMTAVSTWKLQGLNPFVEFKRCL